MHGSHFLQELMKGHSICAQKTCSEEDGFAPKWLAYYWYTVQADESHVHFVTMATGGANGFIFLILLFKWRNVAPLASVRKEHDVGGKCNSKAHFPLALEYFLILVNCLRKSLAYQKVLLSWWWSVQSSNKIYFDELKVPQCPLHCTQMCDCVRIWKSEFFSCACLWIYFLFFPGVS